jgi:hypothetical protein
MTDGDPGPGPLNIEVGVDDLEGDFAGPEFDLHRARAQFTWFVLGTFGLTILAALISAFTGNWHAMLQVLERLLPAESAVVGATVGFYFISKPLDP